MRVPVLFTVKGCLYSPYSTDGTANVADKTTNNHCNVFRTRQHEARPNAKAGAGQTRMATTSVTIRY